MGCPWIGQQGGDNQGRLQVYERRSKVVRKSDKPALLPSLKPGGQG